MEEQGKDDENDEQCLVMNFRDFFLFFSFEFLLKSQSKFVTVIFFLKRIGEFVEGNMKFGSDTKMM